MKPGLSLDLQQSLKLSPQLQQAIHLLQLTCFELRQEILLECEQNPLLELDESRLDDDVSFEDSVPQPLSSSKSSETDIPWETAEQSTLQDHLRWQVNTSPFTEQDELIANVLIDAINEDGYLSDSLENVLPEGIDIEEASAVLHRIQHFDPLGAGSTSLEECLTIQADEYYAEHPLKLFLDKAITNSLAVIAKKGVPGLASKLHTSEENAQTIIECIQSLRPKPGAAFGHSNFQYVIPDGFVRKVNEQWQVKLNMSYLPRVNLQQEYINLLNTGSTSSDQLYLKGHLQRAKWFLKSLENRNQTLMSVFTLIVRYQESYLENGDIAMRPLILQTLADELGFHPSTISRVTIGKYLHTPHGIIPVKHLFSSKLATESGLDCSAVAIKALIQENIKSEDKGSPLSDEKLCQALKAKGIHIARRTVAKYRESMGISAAHARRNK
ncbi:MAG: RNA polymerase sigma-54 factor [Legionellales bacterium]|nr:RNA polymerase sigma-54 factor [Legionellales bacterium]|tara:strand:+ start:2111 stop:3433 length:1323 start_codon:yes stop_codon:yes gene_type:complete